MKFPLRITIPALLVLFTIALASWSLRTNGDISMRNVEASMRAKLNITLTVLQEDIEHELRTKDFHRIQRKLSSLRSDYNLKHISLIDEKDNVFMKGKFDIKRKILNDILPSDKIQRDEIKKQIVLAKKDSLE